MINSDLIEYLESTPDTVIALTTGQRLIVLESPDEIVRRIIAFRRELQNPLYCAMRNPPEPSPSKLAGRS